MPRWLKVATPQNSFAAIPFAILSHSTGKSIIFLGSKLSKSLKKNILKKIELMKHYTSICNSAPAEILSLISLSNKDKILGRNNRIIEDNLRLLDQFFDDYSQLFEWARPQGGCVGFAKYKGDESIDSFCDRLVNEKSLLLMPASIYSHDSNHFRIGFGRINILEALEKLKEFLIDENIAKAVFIKKPKPKKLKLKSYFYFLRLEVY